MYDHVHIMKLIAAEGFLEHHKPLGLTCEALLKGTWYYRISVTLPEVKWWTLPFDKWFLSRHFLLFLFSLPLNPDSYLRAAYANGADNWGRTSIDEFPLPCCPLAAGLWQEVPVVIPEIEKPWSLLVNLPWKQSAEWQCKFPLSLLILCSCWNNLSLGFPSEFFWRGKRHYLGKVFFSPALPAVVKARLVDFGEIWPIFQCRCWRQLSVVTVRTELSGIHLCHH